MRKLTNLIAASVTAVLAVGGCSETNPPANTSQTSTTKSQVSTTTASTKEEHGHTHGEGPHGGALSDWGGGTYHVEFTVDHDKTEATVYILGDDAKTPAPIKAVDGKLQLAIKEPPTEVELKASPQEGDPEGTASKFVGQHKNLGVVREYEGSISGEVGDTPYTADFKEEPHEEAPKPER